MNGGNRWVWLEGGGSKVERLLVLGVKCLLHLAWRCRWIREKMAWVASVGAEDEVLGG